jgi:hypothetical protein
VGLHGSIGILAGQIGQIPEGGTLAFVIAGAATAVAERASGLASGSTFNPTVDAMTGGRLVTDGFFQRWILAPFRR